MAKKEEKKPKKDESLEKDQEEELDLESEEAEQEPDPDYGEVLATWKFLEYETPDRSRKWYIGFIVIFVLLILLSVFGLNIPLFKMAEQRFEISFDENPLFIVLLAMFTIVYFYAERKGPPMVRVAITEDGLLIQNKLIEYKEFESFYIIYQPPGIKNIYFQPKSHIKPLMMVPLGEENPIEIRKMLLEFLEEDLDKENEAVTDGLSRALKL